MNDLLLIGDVHGNVNSYWKILQKHKKKSIQLGDFGFKWEHQWHLNTLYSDLHKVCFGNHDDPSFLKSPHSLGDYSFLEEYSLMSIRGAFSIDKVVRTEGKDWWPNEEMNYEEMSNCVDFFIKKKPKIVVSHDCPNHVREEFFFIKDKSLTTNAMQLMLEFHKPDLWVFGHHHKYHSKTINGTKFICLPELGTLLI